MLLDHFHPPLKGRRHWDGFHSRWAGNIAAQLNQELPAGWFAEPTVHWGIEVDVATFEDDAPAAGPDRTGGEGQAWQPESPLKTIDFPLATDAIEVLVYHDFGDVPLVGAIELVSPANKDRPETREAFVSKCAAYLHDGVGLVLIDVVTDRAGNLHSDLLEHVGESEEADDPIYVSAYRPARRDEQGQLSIWYHPLQIGGGLPEMPLYLKQGPVARVDLAETYRQTCRDLRLEIVT